MPIVAVPLAAAALVLLLLYFAGRTLHITPFEGIAHFGGTVGGLILRWFASGIEWAIGNSLGDIRAGIRGVEGLMLWPAFWARSHSDAVAGRLYQSYLVSRRILSVMIPGAISAALGTVRGWVHTTQLLASAENAATLAWASKQFTAVYADIAASASAETRYAAGLFDSAQKYAAAGIAADAAYASHLFSQSITYTDGVAHGLETWVGGQVAGVTSWAGGQISALEKYIAAVGAGASAFTIARVGVVEQELTRLERECTDNLCSGVGPLASLLNSLAGDLGIAALISLAAEAARDPRGTASVIEGAFGPVAREGAAIMRSAVGL